METAEKTAEEAVKEVVGDKFVGGEVMIKADASTGGIMVSAPQNLIIALGLIEMAKVVLVEKQKEAMRAVKPAIIPAKPGDVPPFDGRKSS